MTTLAPTTTDRYTIISADCHAGGNHAQYREYLDADVPATSSTPGAASTRTRSATSRTTAAPATGTTSAASATSHADGTSPRSCSRTRCRRSSRPASSSRRRPTRRGLRAPARRPPRPQPLARRLRAARAPASAPASSRSSSTTSTTRSRTCAGPRSTACAGHPAARRLARHSVDRAAVLADEYDPLWARVRGDLGMPVTHHSGGSGIPNYGSTRSPPCMFVLETASSPTASLWHLIDVAACSSASPNLKLVLTEQGCAWVPDAPAPASTACTSRWSDGRIGELGLEGRHAARRSSRASTSRATVDRRQLPRPSDDARAFHEIGLDHVMWGSDYPHNEGAFAVLAGVAAAGVLRLERGRPAHRSSPRTRPTVYGFDLDELAPIAAEVGPTVDEVATPLDRDPGRRHQPGVPPQLTWDSGPPRR